VTQTRRAEHRKSGIAIDAKTFSGRDFSFAAPRQCESVSADSLDSARFRLQAGILRRSFLKIFSTAWRSENSRAKGEYEAGWRAQNCAARATARIDRASKNRCEIWIFAMSHVLAQVARGRAANLRVAFAPLQLLAPRAAFSRANKRFVKPQS